MSTRLVGMGWWKTNQMNSDDLEFVDSALLLESIAKQVAVSDGTKESRRSDRRIELVTQASVLIPPLRATIYEIREISRGGMFLAFKQPGQLLQIETASIGVGANAEVAFTVVLENRRQQLSVRARIARIGKKGIGFEFLTRNPPQLAALRALFSQSGPDTVMNARQTRAEPVTTQQRKIQKPADDSGWQDWKLAD